MRRTALNALVALSAYLSVAALAEESASLASIEDFAADLERTPGFFDLLMHPVTAETFLVVPRAQGEFIFQTSLPRGVGSNDLGFDRGRLEDTRLVRFERVGRRALLRALNTDYRADSNSASERRAVEEAFASSVLTGLEVVAENSEAYVVAYTPFLTTDVTRIGPALDAMGEGTFKVDADRSAVWPTNTRSFPRNTELEAVVTLTGTPKGRWLQTVAPDPSAITAHVRHSLIALPEDGYVPRTFHPRSGFFVQDWVDYASPLLDDMRTRVIPRHRLEAVDASKRPLVPVKPIIYYLDSGAPEPVRSALLEGGAWWADAFKAAGWSGAFEVRMLPEDADPLDVRYNVIQWVHRSTRGWSYGTSVRDPRTGEILKGQVSLGSLRVRQDLLIARALSAAEDGEAVDAEALDLALARLRQLSAHEIGHTLGLAHNFAASTQGRTSVMDYPHPLLGAASDPLKAAIYDVGIGAWDKHAIRYGYALPTADQSEADALRQIIADAAALAFMSDADARPIDAAHPAAHLWDNGDDPVSELEHLLDVRAGALARLDATRLRPGAARSDLEAMLVPLYYLHRYQTEAVARLLGGFEYGYATRGAPTILAVPGDAQRRALDALLRTLAPSTLTLDDGLVRSILPQAYGWQRTREAPPGRMGLAFDAVTPAEAAAEHTLGFLLAPGRLARLDQQHAMDPSLPDVAEVLMRLVEASVLTPEAPGLADLVRRRIALLVTEHLAMLAWNEIAAPEVTSTAQAIAVELVAKLEAGSRPTPVASHHRARLAALLRQAAEEGHFARRDDVARMPPGSPI